MIAVNQQSLSRYSTRRLPIGAEVAGRRIDFRVWAPDHDGVQLVIEQPEAGVVDEGFTLEFIPLLALDAKTVDAAIRCDIDQVERMVPVTLNVPTTVAPRQSTKIDVPQMVHFRFHERFRWPVDRILLIGMGVVPVPVPSEAKSIVPGLPLPISSGPPRADLLLVVESRGKAAPQTPQVSSGMSPAPGYYRGR